MQTDTRNLGEIMKPTFLNSQKPIITLMVLESTPEDAISVINKGLRNGADAFGIQLELLRREYRNLDNLKRIFAACGGKPIYITSYRNQQSEGYTDQECMDFLLLGCKAGATLCDIMADMYDPQPNEITYDEEAVRKQIKIADEIHKMGGEVLFLTHTHKFFDSDTILKIALAQKERGADVVKIVSVAENDDELEVSFNNIKLLKKELGTTPFLYLVNGAKHKPIRENGCDYGVCMYLCVNEHRTPYSTEQPLISRIKEKNKTC